MSGVLERAIENWLTKVNERQYQLPFCQVLAARGEAILYVSTHGPFEKGKDIITRTRKGEINAYQLKAGNIGVGEWRAISGEVANLVEYAIELPGETPITRFTPFLVTNGELTAPALEQVRAANVSWRSRGIDNQLRTIEKGQLFDLFRAAHGAYLPKELEDFQTFFELILHDGSAPAEKVNAARLIEHIISRLPSKPKVLDISRAATSIALLTAYISGPPVQVLNHWSVFEYWVLAGAYILHMVEAFGEGENEIQTSFEICELAAEEALKSLADECKTRPHFVQGFGLVDGHVYGARITLLAGLLSALDLSQRIRGKSRTHDEVVARFLRQRTKEARPWGESAIPYFFAAILHAMRACNSNFAEGAAVSLLSEIANTNNVNKAGRGCANPYYSPEAALRLNYGLDGWNDEQFIGLSYTAGTLIEFVTRRWMRKSLQLMWYRLTRLSLAEYVPASHAEWLRWDSTEGKLDLQLVDEPQSWKNLQNKAASPSLGTFPPTLAKRPAFTLWMTLVYPHRLAPGVAKFIEDAVMQS